MQKNTVTVIDIGSSGITAAAVENGLNNTFVIKGFSRQNYAGFSEGEFFDRTELEGVLRTCLKQVRFGTKNTAETVYVGVPGEFTTVVLKEHQIAFNKSRKITENELNELYDTGYTLKSQRYCIINRSGVVFTLDDTRKTADPVGETSKLLRGTLSYVLCDKYFTDTITPFLKKCGVENVEYVSGPLAEALYLFPPETRDRTAVLADVGYITTSFSVIQGDAVIYQKGFPYGGGYITAMFTEFFNIDPDIAEKLKRKVNLSLASNDEIYKIVDGDEEYAFPAEKVNEIVFASLDELCENIEYCLTDSRFAVPDYVSLSLTGGGIGFIRGAKEHISKRLNLVVETLSPRLPNMNKPTDSSLAALMKLALSQPVKKQSFFKKLFK